MDTKVNYAGIARRVIAHIIDCSVVMGTSLYQFPLCKEQIDNNGKEVIIK